MCLYRRPPPGFGPLPGSHATPAISPREKACDADRRLRVLPSRCADLGRYAGGLERRERHRAEVARGLERVGREDVSSVTPNGSVSVVFVAAR